MTLEEVALELLGDLPNADHIIAYRHEKFKSAVLKSTRFPVIRHHECKTIQRKNRFFVNFAAFKRGQWKELYNVQTFFSL